MPLEHINSSFFHKRRITFSQAAVVANDKRFQQPTSVQLEDGRLAKYFPDKNEIDVYFKKEDAKGFHNKRPKQIIYGDQVEKELLKAKIITGIKPA